MRSWVQSLVKGEEEEREEGGRKRKSGERRKKKPQVPLVAILRPSNALKSESKPRGHLKLASPWVLLSDLSINSMLSLN